MSNPFFFFFYAVKLQASVKPVARSKVLESA